MTVVDDQVQVCMYGVHIHVLVPCGRVYCTMVAIIVHCPYARCVVTVYQLDLADIGS